ncbi:hypothetical protein [Burkholderia sp. Ac-20365]|uniref:hypothetical protein n=1 Tax=Burkholderia sp. Ac-20365 TaxID=2703897 RepID=UPI00197BEAC5|nr:hypothetical protein [Burkholderia sp. Ac-20365]MBN3759869.1 hypothetical protein [Burkholderia sp. Ac-20365]
MKQKPIAAFALTVCCSVAHAGKLYDGYDSFYADQAGQVFPSPVSNDYLPATYGPNGDTTASWEGQVGKMRIKLTVTGRSVRINNRVHRLADAVRSNGDNRVDLDPRSVTLYLASDAGTTGPAICIESTGTGSGTADRYSQVYAISTQSRSGIRLFKLPSLFGSCRSLVRQQGALRFPIFSYRREPNIDDPVGTEVQYAEIEGTQYTSTGQRLTTRFTDPTNVFRFTVE